MSRESKDLGNRGENCAAKFLEQRRHTIVERQYRSAHGEIDLIARDADGVLVFVEVKTRRDADARYGSALDAVDLRKQRHIIAAAQDYLAALTGETPRCRFDVIALTVNADGQRCRLRHLRDAFTADDSVCEFSS